MARIRTVKPEFWTDGDILKLSLNARLFYIGLWNFCDDNGVIEYDLVAIKARIFPNDRVCIEKLLQELLNLGKALIYEVEKRQYIFIKNLTQHQVIDRPRKSNLPLPNTNQMKSTEIILGRKEGRERKGRDGIDPAPEKMKFLDFVFMTKNEFDSLVEKLGESTVKDYIERLNNYVGAKGVKYKSHYHAILSWSNKDTKGKPIEVKKTASNIDAQISADRAKYKKMAEEAVPMPNDCKVALTKLKGKF